MSNESHPSPTGSSSSSLFGGGSSNTAGASGPSPSKTWAQVLNSNPSTPSNASASASLTTNNAANVAHTGLAASPSGNTRGISPSSSSPPSSQHSTTTTSTAGGGGAVGQPSTTRSISPSQVTPNIGAFNFSGSRSGFLPNFHDPQSQQQQSQMNWPLNFNQPSSSSSWMMDDETQRHLNLAGSSSQQSLDSNHNTTGDGDGFDQLETSSPTSDWGKPVPTNNSTANGWSNFQQQQTHGNPSRSNAVGNNNNNNTNSNQWPEINNFYGTNSSTGVPFNLSQNNNDNNSGSSTWQDSSSNNTNETLGLATNSSNSSVINKHKASSSAAMAASLTGALKSAIALGGANPDPAGGNSDTPVNYTPQPKLVEQLGWDEPEIKVTKRANFDDGTSIWGDPMESMGVQLKKWTNGPKAALTNSTNTIIQPQSSIVQKPTPTSAQGSNSGPSAAPMTHDENWPKQQSPTLPQSSSQWNDTAALSERGTPPPPPPSQQQQQQQGNYRAQQSGPGGWNSQSQHSGYADERFLDGVIDTSSWGLQSAQNKIAFDPYEGRIDPSSWGVQGGAGNNMGGPLPMGQMNRNRFTADYDLTEGTHDPHSMPRMSSYDNPPMTDPYRQGSDLKSPIIGIGGLLPAAGNPQAPPHHMLPPSQLPFAPRPGSHYQPSNIMRQMNPNGISAPSGAIMGTGGLISPKLSTTSPVPNQAPYAPLTAKQGPIPTQSSQTPTPQQQQQQGGGNTNSGAVHAQIMQQFRLAVQAGLISQDLLNTKLPPFMLQLLQKLFELQQKYQALTVQLNDFSKHKQRFPITFFQTEYERLTKLITQKRQEMLIVQKQIQDAHAKLVQQQQQSGTPTGSSQLMTNGPGGVPNQSSSGGSSQSQDQLADRLQQSLNVDQSRLHQWTKQHTSNRGGPSSSSMFAPPGLSQKDWQTASNNPNENWENTQTNDSNTNNPMSNMDAHNSQASSSAFGDPLSEFVDDADGPPPFIPGQPWNWKSSMHSAEDDPHATPSSFTMGPKGPSSSMTNLNVGGVDSAFSNPQMLHHMQRRMQWQNDQQGFQPSMNDWGKPQQYRGSSKPPQSLNHPPPSHSSFGGYRPYMQ